ncbi:hypothetical protein ACNJD8_21685, partial [Mycobacterium tuberculosis]
MIATAFANLHVGDGSGLTMRYGRKARLPAGAAWTAIVLGLAMPMDARAQEAPPPETKLPQPQLAEPP